jgi:hypothetical protein
MDDVTTGMMQSRYGGLIPEEAENVWDEIQDNVFTFDSSNGPYMYRDFPDMSPIFDYPRPDPESNYHVFSELCKRYMVAFYMVVYERWHYSDFERDNELMSVETMWKVFKREWTSFITDRTGSLVIEEPPITTEMWANTMHEIDSVMRDFGEEFYAP